MNGSWPLRVATGLRAISFGIFFPIQGKEVRLTFPWLPARLPISINQPWILQAPRICNSLLPFPHTCEGREKVPWRDGGLETSLCNVHVAPCEPLGAKVAIWDFRLSSIPPYFATNNLSVPPDSDMTTPVYYLDKIIWFETDCFYFLTQWPRTSQSDSQWNCFTEGQMTKLRGNIILDRSKKRS